jgi:hypothetical protein
MPLAPVVPCLCYPVPLLLLLVLLLLTTRQQQVLLAFAGCLHCCLHAVACAMVSQQEALTCCMLLQLGLKHTPAQSQQHDRTAGTTSAVELRTEKELHVMSQQE